MLVCRTVLYCSAFCVLCRSAAKNGTGKRNPFQTIPNYDPQAVVYYHVSRSSSGNHLWSLDVDRKSCLAQNALDARKTVVYCITMVVSFEMPSVCEAN